MIEHAGADGQTLVDRNIDHTLEVDQPEIADPCAGKGVKSFEIGRIGDHVDHTHGGVATVESALRPLEHLDSRDIHKGDAGDCPRQVGIVVEGGHRRILPAGNVRAFNSADFDAELRRLVGCDRAEAYAGHEIVNVGNVQRTGVDDVLRAESIYRDGH